MNHDNIENILALVKAGFTADEIRSLTTAQETRPEATGTDGQTVTQTVSPETDQNPDPMTPPEAAPQDTEQQLKGLFDNMLDELKGMREDLQKRSIIGDDQQIMNPEEAGTRILAQIIDPPVFDKKNDKKGKKK